MLLGGTRFRAAMLAAAFAAFGAFGDNVAYAQRPQQQQKAPPTPEEFAKLQDTPISNLKVHDVQLPNIIIAENFAGEPIVTILLVQAPGYSTLSVHGTAELSALKPGMFVRFSTTVDEKGVAAGEISALEIYTPSPNADPEEITPGSESSIGGKVLKYKDGKLDVQVNSKKIKKVSVPVASTAAITVAATDLSLVRKGDTVSGTTKTVEKQSIGANVQIEMANPLSGPKKKEPAARPARGGKARPEADAKADDKTDGDKPAAEAGAAKPEDKKE